MEKYGYDTKFASHLIRLMYEGQHILRTGRLIFPLPEADFLREIREGKYSMEYVLKLSDDMEKDIVQLEKESTLPAKPRYAEIEQLLMAIVQEYLHG